MRGRLGFFSKKRIGIIILLLILVLLAPTCFITSHGPPVGHQPVSYSSRLISFIWTLVFSSNDAGEIWYIAFFNYLAIGTVLQLPFRALFFFEGIRYSEGKSSHIRIIASGSLGDLLMTLPIALMNILGSSTTVIALPLMTVIGIPILWKLREGSKKSHSEPADGLAKEKVQERTNQTNDGAFIITLFLFFLAIILPFVIFSRTTSSDSLNIFLQAIMYNIGISSTGSGFNVLPFLMLFVILRPDIYQIFRFLVPVFAYFHFSDRISLKRTMAVGVVLEILMGIPYNIALLVSLAIPLPMISLSIIIISKILSKRDKAQITILDQQV